MAETVARPPVRIVSVARHPVYAMLFPVAAVCFLGVLITDIAYVKSDGNLMWLSFSTWLLFVGLVFGTLAALVLLIDFIRSPAIRSAAGWAHLVLFGTALLVELFSIFIHERDGWTAVVPIGMTASVVGALLILVAGWLRRTAMEPAR